MAVDLGNIDTLVMAGGCNRCWWQARLVQAPIQRGWTLPQNITATSAGATIATSLLTGTTDAALVACKKLYAANAQLFNWNALMRLKAKFAHQHIYPAWLHSLMGDCDYAALQQSQSQLSVAVTQPARWLGLTGSLITGSLFVGVDGQHGEAVHRLACG